MRTVLRRQNAGVHFIADTDSGAKVAIDGSPAVGGEGLGARPMELLLTALGGCSGIDVISILGKQRQTVDDVTITVEGERAQTEPAVFTKIHVHFSVSGPTDERAVQRAVELSMDKYCSVARMVEGAAKIDYSYTLEPGDRPAAAARASDPSA